MGCGRAGGLRPPHGGDACTPCSCSCGCRPAGLVSQVVSAQDGEDALEVLEGMEAWPDLVFLDYHMAGGPSGDEVSSSSSSGRACRSDD